MPFIIIIIIIILQISFLLICICISVVSSNILTELVNRFFHSWILGLWFEVVITK